MTAQTLINISTSVLLVAYWFEHRSLGRRLTKLENKDDNR